MNWIVKIIGEDKQRIKVVFDPAEEKIHFFGEVKIKGNEWVPFSVETHKMVIELDQIQKTMAKAVKTMRKRLKEYNNLNEGFSVIKEVEFQDTED